MMQTNALSVFLIALLCTGMTLFGGNVMAKQVNFALFRVAALTSVPNGCVLAKLVKQTGELKSVFSETFCKTEDILRLKGADEAKGLVSIRTNSAGMIETWPVTVGLDVTLMGHNLRGDLRVMAFPRPSPIIIPMTSNALVRFTKEAVQHKKSVAFALSDSFTVVDAAEMDRDSALAMLGMQPQ